MIMLLPGYSVAYGAENKKFTVVIDAGHGGKDIGATDNGVMEKNINLQVAKQLEQLIKKKMKNTNVVMTRDNDSYLTLQQRADKANKAHGDLFISIHTNSVDKKNKNRSTVAGSSVYTLGLHKDENNLEVAMRENSVIELEQGYQQKYSGFDPQRDESYIIFEMAQKKNLSRSIQFAESVEKELVKAGRQDKGVHQAGFWVLWATSMPSVLVELDFICNPESAKYLSSDKGAKELAEAIFNAVQKYEVTWKRTLSSAPGKKTNSDYADLSETVIEEVALPAAEEEVATAKKRSQNTKSSANKSAAETKTSNDAGNSSATAVTAASSRGRIDTAPGAQSRASESSAYASNSRKSTARRRRSNRSRTISMNQTFENGNLTYGVPTMGKTATVDDEPMLAAVDAKTKAKNEKKERQQREKEEKERQKREKEEQKRLQAEAKKAAKVRKADAHNAKVNKIVTVYKIQILASTDLLHQGHSRFCGLTPITTYKEDNTYKYFYGESTNREEMETVLADVKKKIPSAFIVQSQKIMQK